MERAVANLKGLSTKAYQALCKAHVTVSIKQGKIKQLEKYIHGLLLKNYFTDFNLIYQC